MDMIPMDEVGLVMDSDKSLKSEEANWLSRDAPDEDTDAPMSPGESTIVRIETIPNGYNSGRAYYVQVHLPWHTELYFLPALSPLSIYQVKIGAERRLMCQNIQNFAKKAREDALARTRFNKMQEAVRDVFNSTACQTILAILIFAVMPKRCLP